MAAPYTATANPAGAWQNEMRSVTPAMNNTRYTGRYASAPRMGGEMAPHPLDGYAARSMTPNRNYYGRDDAMPEEPRTPSSTGLIRLSLKKPMGIVFEPMYDPHKPTDQRGVRICDLPRTGAAALSRKLQVGDELLQINDTTVSRLTFDEIMDFIIEADPESVNLLFRRPRKETLQARQGVQQKLNAAANKDAPTTIKWVDDDVEGGDDKKKKTKKDKKKDKKDKKIKRSKKGSTSEEERTIESSTADNDSYVKPPKSRSKKKTKVKRNAVESESFLDLLIDTICADSNNYCKTTFRNNDDEYGSEDDESFGTEINDEETYATYDESIDQRASKKTRKKSFEEETQEDSLEQRRHKGHHRKDKHTEKEIIPDESNKKYEDDGTLETVETTERPKDDAIDPTPVVPLGLAPNLVPAPAPAPQPIRAQSDTDDDGNPAPIKEVEYDDRFDHGADVSVMESLGGPSLLIEKQRAAQAAAYSKSGQRVPPEISDKFGLDYPVSFGMTREQTIEADPLKYYTFVVRGLLEENEPEKVRLLDKLLAKYKGREDHLIQKLSVRYNRTQEEGGDIPEEHDETAFSDAVKKNKTSLSAAQAVSTAKERLNSSVPEHDEMHRIHEWPEKETKEPDEGDEESDENESEYSRESVDGTSPAVIAQVSELLNYVYGKTSVPGQIDRVSTIMRAYEGREAVLLELLETKALIKANKEKENADNLPSFLRNSQLTQAQKDADEMESDDLPPVTPMATQPREGTVINDDISSMSGVSSPAPEKDRTSLVQESPAQANTPNKERKTSVPMKEMPKINASSSKLSQTKPPATPDKRKKKGLFGGLFGGKKKTKDSDTPTRTPGSKIGRKLKGNKSVEGSI